MVQRDRGACVAAGRQGCKMPASESLASNLASSLATTSTKRGHSKHESPRAANKRQLVDNSERKPITSHRGRSSGAKNRPQGTNKQSSLGHPTAKRTGSSSSKGRSGKGKVSGGSTTQDGSKLVHSKDVAVISTKKKKKKLLEKHSEKVKKSPSHCSDKKVKKHKALGDQSTKVSESKVFNGNTGKSGHAAASVKENTKDSGSGASLKTVTLNKASAATSSISQKGHTKEAVKRKREDVGDSSDTVKPKKKNTAVNATVDISDKDNKSGVKPQKKKSTSSKDEVKEPKRKKGNGLSGKEKQNAEGSSLQKKSPSLPLNVRKVFRKELTIKKGIRTVKNMFGFWRGPKVRRVASLNALAKVHILYENEARTPVVPDSDKDNNSSGCKGFRNPAILDAKDTVAGSGNEVGLKAKVGNKAEQKKVSLLCKSAAVTLLQKKGKQPNKFRMEASVEHSVVCRRMASLNAQAILAASYSTDRPRRPVKLEPGAAPLGRKRDEAPKKVDNDKASLTVVKEKLVVANSKVVVANKLLVTKKPKSKSNKETVKVKVKVKTSEKVIKRKATEKKLVPKKIKNKHVAVSRGTQKKERKFKRDDKITLIQIDSSDNSDVKSDRERSEKVEDTAEVTITGVYINPTTNTSFCISRIQTYKQSQSYSPPPSPPPSQGQAAAVHLQPAAHLVGSMLHSTAHLPTGIYPFPNTVMPSSSSQSYPINGISNLGSVPVVNVALPRHYSSAFTVPHYGHPAPITYTHGYYQPAGPLIQTITDPCLIHKPVPYHPHLQQTATAGAPPPSSQIYSQERCTSHPTPPQSVPFPHDQCPHPTPPYSTQPCNQTKCTAAAPPPAAPPATHFPTDQCHSHTAPQEGFFPEHCPVQAATAQQFHNVPQPFQPSKPYNPQVTQTYIAPDHSAVGCPAAPTLQVQPKAERVLPVEDASLQPPVLTPIKPLQPGCEKRKLISTGIPKDQPKNVSPTANVRGSKKEQPSVREVRKCSQATGKLVQKTPHNGSVLEMKVDCRRVRVEIESSSPRKKDCDSAPVGRSSIKLLRSDKRALKRRHTELSEDSHMGCVKRTRMPAERKSRGTTSPQQRCSEEAWTASKRCHLTIADGSHDHSTSEASTVGTTDLVPQRSGRRPSATITTSTVNNHNKSACDKRVAIVQVTPLNLSSRSLLKNKVIKKAPRFSNGWTWEGEPLEQQIQLHNDDPPVLRHCYPAMRHIEGDIIRARDCVLLKSGARKIDLPFVAKIAALWENPEDGEMMMSLLWYYRPEHTELGRKPHHIEDEIFASKHKDVNSVACIEDRCYVLTFNEYCRYRRRIRLLEEGLRPQPSVVPDPEEGYARKDRQPPGRVSADMVFVCRRVYDFRQKRILKNPS